jgi:NAD(P)-dependent dehydrogenase (short-subunit alcohol dehydrogenase family)
MGVHLRPEELTKCRQMTAKQVAAPTSDRMLLMPDFGAAHSDTEIAAVVNYVTARFWRGALPPHGQGHRRVSIVVLAFASTPKEKKRYVAYDREATSRTRLAFDETLNWGRIIFISSESGVQIPSEMIHYGVTTTAQMAVSRGFTEILARPGITVNSAQRGRVGRGLRRQLVGLGDHGSGTARGWRRRQERPLRSTEKFQANRKWSNACRKLG